jgi:hypothetical protein
VNIYHQTPETMAKIQEFAAILAAARRLLDGNMVEHAMHARTKIEEAFHWAEKAISIYEDMKAKLAAAEEEKKKVESQATMDSSESPQIQPTVQ